MSVFFRRTETRAITSVPWNVGAPLHQTISQERALRLAPVYAATRLLADMVSSLPLQGYRQAGEMREKAPTPQLFKTLEGEGRLQPWLFTAMTSLTLRGNAVGLITQTDGFGFPTSIEWLSMDEVSVDDTTGRAQWYVNGRKVDRPDLVHIPWYTIAGRTLGLSPIEAYALTIGGGLSAQAFGSGWFENGGVPPGTFKNEAKVIDADKADAISARLVASIRKRRPLVHGRDWTYTAHTIPPEQAQFIETQKLTANQIAAIYGVDPDEVGGEAANALTYSNEESRQIKRLANARPWLVRLEGAFASILPERQYVKFNGDAIIRADLATRWAVNKIRVDMGAENIDGIRAQEDQPPLPNGQGKEFKAASTPALPAPSEPSPTDGDTRHLSVIPSGGTL